MKLREMEAVHDAVELLVEDLHAKSDAALGRNAQLKTPALRQLARVLRVESEARRLQAGLSSGKGPLRGMLVSLITAATEFDAEFPDGGLLLASEHGEARQMTRTVALHLAGEFSFGFLACEAAARIRADAALILNTICPLHLADWKALAVTA